MTPACMHINTTLDTRSREGSDETTRTTRYVERCECGLARYVVTTVTPWVDGPMLSKVLETNVVNEALARLDRSEEPT